MRLLLGLVLSALLVVVLFFADYYHRLNSWQTPTQEGEVAEGLAAILKSEKRDTFEHLPDDLTYKCSFFTPKCFNELAKFEGEILNQEQRARYQEYFALAKSQQALFYMPFDASYSTLLLFNATKLILWQEIQDNNRLNPEELINLLEVFRYRLKLPQSWLESNSDSAFQLSLISAINLAYSQDPELLHNDKILRLIAPLSKTELSAERLIAGEITAISKNLETMEIPLNPFKALPYYYDNWRIVRALDRTAKLSLKPNAEYWSASSRDLLKVYTKNLIAFSPVMISDNRRVLDYRLALLNAAREIYLGKKPQDITTPSPEGFSKPWLKKENELCIQAESFKAISYEYGQFEETMCLPIWPPKPKTEL